MKVLVADRFEEVGLEGLRSLGCEVAYEPKLEGEALGWRLRDTGAEVLVVRSTIVTAAEMDQGKGLALVIRAGAGVNTIDLAADCSVVNRTAGIAAGTFPAVIDQTATQQRSWIGLGTGATSDPPVIPPATFGTVDSFGFPGNWMVRGFGQTDAPCTAPEDVLWLSVNPTAGTTVPAATSPVAVTLDSTGLAPGIYLANLCVASDDPDPGPGNGTELVVVPVELTVEDAGPGPSVLEIPALGPAGAALPGLARAGLGLGAPRRRRG